LADKDSDRERRKGELEKDGREKGKGGARDGGISGWGG